MDAITLAAGRMTAEGSHYEIGLALARLLDQSPALRCQNITPPGLESPDSAALERLRLLEHVCPGLAEEVSGLCDGAKLRPGRLALLGPMSGACGQCSQIAALPAATADGHLYVARSYEYDPEDELLLQVVRARGKPAHAGFSLLLVGRTGGMNEHGLCVSMSSCAFMQPPSGEGVWFPFILRALLDRCASVEDACALLQSIPIRSNDSILLADRTGRARVAEVCSFGSVKRLSFRDADDLLIAVNHYQNADMLGFDNHRGRHSVLRWRAARDRLFPLRGRIDAQALQDLLQDPMPHGLSCPYYREGLGTLHAALFDVTAGHMQVCFGRPAPGAWESIRLDGAARSCAFAVTVQNSMADNPAAFWRILPPGCTDAD